MNTSASTYGPKNRFDIGIGSLFYNYNLLLQFRMRTQIFLHQISVTKWIEQLESI